MIIDKLYEEVEKKGVVCVGLDTKLEYIPDSMKAKYKNISDMIFAFNKEIIDYTIDEVAVYKPQIAFYETHGIEGLKAYKKTLKYIKEKGAISIGDIKRGDISSTAQMYGDAHFNGDFEADFITLNPYMGFDSITPYLEYIKTGKKGIFVLLRTSNQGAKDIQYLKSEEGKMVYEHVGDRLKEIAKDYEGKYGYSPVSIVVGGTHKDLRDEIRERYDNMFFLVPGYGAQGGKGSDVSSYLKNGNGSIINSSRGIITSYKNYEDGEENIGKYAKKAVIDMKKDIQSSL